LKEPNVSLRIAILADIHGNLPAFEAALEHVARQHADRLIIAGVIVVGARHGGVLFMRQVAW